MIRSIVFAVLMSTGIAASAQVSKTYIKGDYTNTSLLSFIEDVQQKHGIQFLYTNDIVQRVMLTGVLKYKLPILKALEILLRDQPISCASYQDDQIVLFPNKKKIVQPVKANYSFTGTITDKETGTPLPYVTVYIPGASAGAVSDDKGVFEIKQVASGLYLVDFRSLGFSPLTKKVMIDSNTSLAVELHENSLELKEIVITPSIFEISTIEVTPMTLNKEEILHSPNMGKDIYRTLRALPGIANTDFSSKARIRGGHSEETGVYLDNLLINDPFHLDEVDGTFSIFNTDYVDELTVLTGGFSAKYTDRLSGLIDVKTSDKIEADKYRLSVDLLNVSFLTQKKINDKVGFFFTGRRGYLDMLLERMNAETDILRPRFSDFWSKVTYQPNRKNTLTFNMLVGRDNFHIADTDFSGPQFVKNIRNNINTWVNWKWFPSENFNSITTLAYQLQQKYSDFSFSENYTNNNRDNNQSTSAVLTNTSYWDISDRSTLEAGMEWRQFVSSYDYRENRFEVFQSVRDSILTASPNFESNFSGYTAAAYAQYSLKVKEGLTLQPGIRMLSQSFSPEIKLAPRLAASYAMTPSITLKLAWGIYYQPDLYFKLRPSLGQEKPYRKNSQATQYTGSLTYTNNKTNVMLNAYYKDYTTLYDDYRFEFVNRMAGVSILDKPFGTTAGTSRGIELMFRQSYGKKSMLSVSYARSKSTIVNDRGQETYRDFDQPHVIIVNNIFRLPKHWNISLLWSYHTGYPYTPTQFSFYEQRQENSNGVALFYTIGDKNSKRLPNFHSLDMRLEKSWHIRKHSITAYVNIVNMYNQTNIRNYVWGPYRYRDTLVRFQKFEQTTIPRFISPGLTYTFY